MAYLVLTEENDRKHTISRDGHGDADLHGCHPAIARVCRRFARELAMQLQPDFSTAYRHVPDADADHDEMLADLDDACRDWRQRVQDCRALVDP